MLKKDLTYEDLDGDQVTETFYFNISQAELAKLNIKYNDNVEEHFQAVIKRGDRAEIVGLFEDFILMSVGRRSADNKSFIKLDGQVAQEFKDTDAYSVLFMSLLQDNGKEFQRFLVGILPSKLQDRMREELEKQTVVTEETAALSAELNSLADPSAKEGLGEFKLIQRVDGAPKSVSAMEGLDGSDGLDKLESYSRAELIGMSEENFKKLMGRYTGGNIPKILLQVALQRM